MILFTVISICYVILMVLLIYGWKKVPEFELKSLPAEAGFSIVVPFRNEAENLTYLLNSLASLQYPASHFEILLINDASEDQSKEICANFRKNHPELSLQILDNKRFTGSPKKDAITKGIENARFENILTTDADCEVPATWLQTFNEIIIATKAKLIAGPVKIKTRNSVDHSLNSSGIKKGKSYSQVFEELDFMALQGAGIGAFGISQPFICNGANLCYKKSAFIEVDGFIGNAQIAGGDDVFLLQKFQEKGWSTAYLKCEKAIVTTTPQANRAEFISQRIRWAAKASAYTTGFSKFAGLTVLLMNFSLVTGAFLTLFNLLTYQTLLIMFLLKFNLDFVFLYHSATFFRRELLLRNYFWSSFIYPFFVSFIALNSFFSGFEWKGRTFRK